MFLSFSELLFFKYIFLFRNFKICAIFIKLIELKIVKLSKIKVLDRTFVKESIKKLLQSTVLLFYYTTLIII